jgi:putative copper resistance protein D
VIPDAASLIAARFVHYTATAAAFGGTAFRAYAFQGGVDASGAACAGRAFDRWLLLMSRVGALLALCSGTALLWLTSAAMAGTAPTATGWSVIGEVLVGTEFGHVWGWRLLLAGALVATACVPPTPRRRATFVLLAALLLASLALTGHAAMETGPAGIAHQLADALHLLAAGLWVGGLWPLLYLLSRARRGDPSWLALARAAVPFFSVIGSIAVMTLALTGTVNALLLVGRVGALFATPYGRLLVAKLMLFATMIALALINRYRLAAHFANEAADVAPFRRSVLVEQALGLAVLAAVSVLGTWPPVITVTSM